MICMYDMRTVHTPHRMIIISYCSSSKSCTTAVMFFIMVIIPTQVRFVYFEEQVPLANKRERKAAGGPGEYVSRGGITPGDTPRTSPGDVGKEDEEDRPLFCVETAAW